ncbi:MAG: lipoyl synthase, partial [Bacteroidales bacterium]|nr:lipoyl synthase [Bacteroidales bacterium]
MENSRRKPDWLKIRLPIGELSEKVQDTIRDNSLHTI